MKACLPFLCLVLLVGPLQATLVTVVDESAPLFQDKVRQATIYQGMVVESQSHDTYDDWLTVNLEGHSFTSPKKHYRSIAQLEEEQREGATAFTKARQEIARDLAQAMQALTLLTTGQIQLDRDRCLAGMVIGKDGKQEFVSLVDAATGRKLEHQWKRDLKQKSKEAEELESRLAALTAARAREHLRLEAAKRLIQSYQQAPKTYLWQANVVARPTVKFFQGKKSQIVVREGTLVMARPNFKHNDWQYVQYQGEAYNVYAPYLHSHDELTLAHELTMAQLMLKVEAIQRQLAVEEAARQAMAAASEDLREPSNATGEAYIRVPMQGPPPGRHPLYSLALPGTEPPLLSRSDAKRQINRWEKDLEDGELRIRDLNQKLEKLETQRASEQQTFEAMSERLSQLERGFSLAE